MATDNQMSAVRKLCLRGVPGHVMTEIPTTRAEKDEGLEIVDGRNLQNFHYIA